jgi:type II secretory pathway pseudopilin PulG
MRRERRRARRGSLFLEAAIALAVIAVVFGMLAWRQSQASRDARDAAAAASLRMVQQVATSIVTRNVQPVLALFTASCDAKSTTCPAGSVRRITRDTRLPELLGPDGQPDPGPGPTLVELGLFPPGFRFADPHGQSYEIWLKRTGATRLEGLVVTTGGAPPGQGRAIAIATRADASDGGVITGDGTVAQGAYGGWSVDLRSYRSADPHLPPAGAGHVVALLRFDESRAYADYVHRFPTGADHEPQTMHATLDMNQQSIVNASDVTVQYSIGLRPDPQIVPNGPCGPERIGRLASAAAGEPVICLQDGATALWVRIALLPNCTENQFLSVHAGRLVCTS